MTSPPATTGAAADGNMIWIASYPKSGNTWMRLLLTAALNDGALTGLDDLKARTVSAASRSSLQRFADVSLSDLYADELDTVRAESLSLWSDRAHDLQLLKIHDQRHTRSGIDLVPRTGTRAILHLVRDPRDVAISWAHHSGTELDTAIAALADPDHALSLMPRGISRNVPQWLGTWSNHCASWMTQDGHPKTTSRYEDQLADPAGTLRAVASLARLDIADDVVERSVAATAFGRLQRLEQHSGFSEWPRETATRPFFGVGRSGVWRSVLSAAQAARIETDHGEMMARLGYL